MATRGKSRKSAGVPREKKNAFNTSLLLRVMQAAYLGGAIGEFVLSVEGGVGTIAAIDKSDCVFAFVQAPVGDVPDGVLGFKEPDFLVKVLETIGTDQMEYEVEEDRWLRINMPAGPVKVLLTPPDQIPTAVMEYEEPIAMMKEATTMEIVVAKEACEKFLQFQDLVKNDTTTVSIEIGKVFFGSGHYETRTFHIEAGPAPESSEGDMSVEVFGDFMKAVFKAIDWESKDEPIMMFGPGAPVIVQQGDGFLWSLPPSGVEEGAE